MARRGFARRLPHRAFVAVCGASFQWGRRRSTTSSLSLRKRAQRGPGRRTNKQMTEREREREGVVNKSITCKPICHTTHLIVIACPCTLLRGYRINELQEGVVIIKLLLQRDERAGGVRKSPKENQVR